MTRILTLVAALAAVALGSALFMGRPASEALVMPALAEDTAIEDLVLPDRVLGDPEAPVTVVEYASYTCGHCGNFHGDQFKKLKAEYIDTGKVRFIHREVYFDRIGLWGGIIANCGGDMRYYGISGMLYDQQDQWLASSEAATIIESLRTIGKVAGLNDDELDACLADEDMVTRLVATYQHHAGADEINATPTLVIDGEKHSNMSYEALKEIIEARLAEAG